MKRTRRSYNKRRMCDLCGKIFSDGVAIHAHLRLAHCLSSRDERLDHIKKIPRNHTDPKTGCPQETPSKPETGEETAFKKNIQKKLEDAADDCYKIANLLYNIKNLIA